MAILNLKSDEHVIINGWYGKCHDDSGEVVDILDCPEFDLTTSSDKIKSVYWIESDNTIRSFESGSVTNDFTKLKCGAAYLIYLKKGTGSLDIPNFVASHPDKALQGRITDECSGSGGSDFQFSAVSDISDELDIGYANTDATEYDAEEHYPVIGTATGVQSVDISADGTGLEYTIDGSNWTELTTTTQSITSNFTNLKLRVKVGRTANFTRSIKLIANPENTAFVTIEKLINYSVVINNVTISASANLTEELEEGSEGLVHTFNIEFQNVGGVGVTSTNPFHKIALSETGNYGDGISIPNPTSSPIKIYVKLSGNMPSSDVTTKFNVIGETRNSTPNITLTDAVTITSTVAPRPEITALSVNPETLLVSISTQNTENYGAHHWHYVVQDSLGNQVVGMQMPGFNLVGGGFPNDTIPFSFPTAGSYKLIAEIVDASHIKIAGTASKTAEFTITANDAVLSINKSGVSGVIDIDDTFQTTSVNITSNNLSNIRYSSSTLNNWEFLSQTPTEFSVRLKSDLKNSDLSSGPNILPQETLTITGDVGPRDTSGDSTKSVTFTLNQTIVDNAEFSITAPGGNFTVTDTRNYDGTSMPEFGPFTINSDAVTLSSNILNNWEVKIGTGTWTKSPNFAIAVNGTTFKVRQTNVSVGTYNEILTITPTANLSDNDPSDNPNAINITLNGKINANIATLSNPGKQTLTTIISGNQFSTKTFTAGGQFVKDITISSVSTDWSVTPASPNVGDTVTVAYIGSNEPTGIKSGSFTISASPVTGATLSLASYTVGLEVTINPKTSRIIASPTAISLNTIVSGAPSDTKNLTITSENADDIKVTSIPSGWIVDNGTEILTTNDSIGKSATLTISISDVNTLGSRTGALILEGTPSANSLFFSGNTKTINLSASVNPKQATASSSITSIGFDDIFVNDPIPASKSFTISTSEVDYVEFTSIPTEYTIKQNNVVMNASDNIDVSQQIEVELKSSATIGTFSKKIIMTAHSTDFSRFNSVSTTKSIEVQLYVKVNGKTTSLSINPTSITDTVNQYGDLPSAHAITVTQEYLSSVNVSGGSATTYQVSETETGAYSNSISNLSGNTFYVKLMSTNSPSNVTRTLTVSGTKSSEGATNPSSVSLGCTANVAAFTAGILLSPTSITETYDQNATTTAKQVSLTLDDISSLSITASGKYSVSETESGTFSSSVTLSNPGTSASFFVKCNDTSTVGSATGTITVVGTHTLGGGSTTKTLSCSATINEVEDAGPSTLWLAFSENGNTSGKYSPFYELKHTESEQGEVKNIADSNIQSWNDMVNSGTMPPGVEVVSDSFTFDRTKHSAVHPTAGLFSVFGGGTPGVPSVFQSFFSSDEDYLNGLEGASVTKVVTTGWVTTTTWDVSFTIALDHTKFEFVDPDHETEITSWMTSSSTTNLVEVLITESPTQPNIDALSQTDIASAFNSPSLSLKCGETWNGQLAPTQQTKMVITRDNGGIPEPFNYSAIAQTAPILSSGKWSGVGGGFANNNALGQVKSPKIMYFHFEKASGTKVKFSNGDPSGSHCGIS